MKKKIDLFWYWFIFVVAFVLCFFAINNKKINAYHLNENGNVVSDNLININGTWLTGSSSSYVENNKLYIRVFGGNGAYVLYGEKFPVSYLDYYSFIATYEKGDISRFILRCYSSTDVQIQSCATGSGLNSYLSAYGGQWADLPVSFQITNNDVAYIQVGLVGLDDGTIIGNYYSYENIQLIKGKDNFIYEPYGVYYNENFVGDLATGVISYSSASVTYENTDDGNTYIINDVSSYIDSSFGFLYFDRLWNYLDSLTGSSYDNAWLSLTLNNKMNLNTTYILNSMYNNGNYGVGAKFYQDNNLILNVTNWVNNNYAYCNETSGATCSVQLSNFVNVGDKPDLQNSFTYFDKIEIWSGDTDKRTGSFGFQNISYSQGYNSGYDLGYSTGNSNGEKTGYNQGYNNGYLIGYEKGVDAVEGTDNTLVGLVGGIMTAPVNMLKTIFDFEFLGINLTHFIFSIVSLFIVIWLIKIFL